MAISKAKKGEIVSDVSKILADSKSVTFVNFHKLFKKEVFHIIKKGLLYYKPLFITTIFLHSGPSVTYINFKSSEKICPQKVRMCNF